MAVDPVREAIAKEVRAHRRKGFDSYGCVCGGRITGTSPGALCNHQADAILAMFADNAWVVCEVNPRAPLHKRFYVPVVAPETSGAET